MLEYISSYVVIATRFEKFSILQWPNLFNAQYNQG